MDIFLIEGQKMIFRACFVLFKNFVKSSGFEEAVKQQGLLIAFRSHIKNIKIPPSEFIEKCFKFRGFSVQDIERAKLHAEIGIKTKFPSGLRTKSMELLPSKNNDFGDAGGHESLNQSQPGYSTPQPKQKNFLTSPPVPLKAVILSSDDLNAIWRWLPSRIAVSGMVDLAFSSNIHGISLNTFFSKSEVYEQCLLVVKTEADEIFGAFCSASWKERNLKDDKGNRQTYFGTGESFLFKLKGLEKDGGEYPKHYPWVGPGDGENKAADHARELFMSGSHLMISIGGGNGTGIYIDNTLTHGTSEKCATFDNEPLCKDGTFKINLIEVYGFNKIDY